MKILIAFLCILAAFLGLNLIFFLGLLLISLPVKEQPIKEQKPIYRWACVAFSIWACGMAGVRIHMSGEQLIPKDGRFVFVCNHRSLFDPLTAIVALRQYNVSFISKPSNMKLPVIGKLAWGAGYLPIDRENDRNALKTIVQAVKYLKEDICSIGIYPEGTRSRGEGMLPYHAGSFKLPQKAGVPIVIASSRNTDQVFKNIFRRRTDVYLDILDVIPADRVCASDTTELSEYAHRLAEENLYGK